MPRDLTDIARQRSRQLQDEYPWLWLYEVEVPTDPPTRYRLTNFNAEVEHGVGSDGEPLVYSPVPIVHGGFTESGDGDLPRVQVQLAHEGLWVRRVIEDYDGLVGQPVVIRLVHALDLGDPSASMRFDGQIVSVKVTAERIAWDVSALSVQQAIFPGRRYQRLHCRHRYGSPECGFDLTNTTLEAAHPSCTKTLIACEERGDTEESVLGASFRKHPQRFGGWPGIPRFSSR